MRNFIKICIQNDRLGGWCGAGGYAVLMLVVFAATLAMLAVASAIASPVLLALVAPLIFVACVVNNAKIVNHARSVKAKIEKFVTPKPQKPAGLLLKLVSPKTPVRVSAIFEVQTPPPRAIRPV
ncbi:hypothetical protein [Ferrovum sp.]|jgi:hypothetical protein|uniref:hypothetical protein n=1 Tax=Ferrovum sp. TaxID=2609467 RepID=UPI00262962C9|nr:hypothetical protein [Ferrovum sp.]